MKRYAHVFFDLDHTLWDFRTNSRETLRELHVDLRLAAEGIDDPMELIEEFETINDRLWRSYESGAIDKAVLRVLRFRDTLKRFGVNNDRLARALGDAYLERCPRKSALHDGVQETLEALHGHARLHVITNGFAEVQHLKLRNGGIAHWFDVVLTSEQAGARKPDPRVFQEALRRARAEASGSMMVGDNPVADIAGARGAGMDQAHVLHNGAVAEPYATYVLRDLRALPAIVLGA